MSEASSSSTNRFRVGEVWVSPNSIVYRVTEQRSGNQVVLRLGQYGEGHVVLRRPNDVSGWQRIVEGGSLTDEDGQAHPMEGSVCAACHPSGVYDSEGHGPLDCYACGKKASKNTAGEAGRAAFEAWARPRWRHPADFDQRIGSPQGTYNSIEVQAAWEAWQAASASQQHACVACEGAPSAENSPCSVCGKETPSHSDDAAVDEFAKAMKAKLAAGRAKGRSGWNSDEPGMQQRLSDMLRSHIDKGDPRDVANFAMFLHQRGEAILPAMGKPGFNTDA